MEPKPASEHEGGPSDDDIRRWADEFDATPDQIREAIAAVGPRPADIACT